MKNSLKIEIDGQHITIQLPNGSLFQAELKPISGSVQQLTHDVKKLKGSKRKQVLEHKRIKSIKKAD